MSSYQDQPIRFGLQGVTLKHARDVVGADQATILTNLRHVRGGKSVVRPGQTLQYALAGRTLVHSLRRLWLGTTAYDFIGTDTFLYENSGLIDSGYSGNPLSLVPYRSEIAADSWMYVGDSTKMAKARSDGLVMPIGLAAPSMAPTTALVARQSTVIDPMNSTTGWNPNHDANSAMPLITAGTIPNSPDGGPALTFQTSPGTTTKPYSNWIDKALTLDLTQAGSLGAGSASDSDYMHIWLYVDFPNLINEVRIYFVTSVFTTGTVPGSSPTVNNKGYWKSFPASAFASALAGAPTVPAGLTQEQINAINASLNRPRTGLPTGTAVPRPGTPNPTVPAYLQTGASGAGTWTGYGTIGFPLFRGDFTSFGTTSPITLTSPNGDWGNVTGIAIWVNVVGQLPGGGTSPSVRVGINNAYLFGGYGLDDGPPGTIPYDWVYTHYDPRTGAESNIVGTVASPASSTPKVDVLRGAVNVTPTAYGNSNIRQRFYRRGGTLTDNFYFTGANAGDGATLQDSNTDAFVQGTGLNPPLDHFQPVATVDSNGNTVLAQPVPALWGPIQGVLLACGDPNRAGWLYASKPSEPDHWIQAVEVCSTTEALQHGWIYGDRAWVSSKERLYQVLINLDLGGGLTTLPTPCQHGIAGRWFWAVGLGGMYLGSRDGIYRTSGGDEGVPITDDIRSLFDGDTVNGYAPIDFTHLEALRLSVVGTDLWFGFLDTNGVQRQWIYSLLYQVWREYDFFYPTRFAYAIEDTAPLLIYLGETATGVVDLHSGTTDRGVAINWHYRSGALDQGYPRADKRYGNILVDADLTGSTTFNINALYGDEAANFAPGVTPPIQVGRQHYIVDVFGGATVRAHNLSLDLFGSTAVGGTLYFANLAAALEAGDYVLWETDEIDHGFPGWHTPLWAFFAMRSAPANAAGGAITTMVTLTRTVYDDFQNILLADTYSWTITTKKTHSYIPFQAAKGALFSYRITAPFPFRVYEEETTLTLAPQHGGQWVTVHPFGTEEPGASIAKNPLLAAIRPGGLA